MTETEAFLVLNAAISSGNIPLEKIVEIFGSVSDFVAAASKGLKNHPCPQMASLAEKVCKFPTEAFLKKEQGLIKKKDVSIVTYYDPNYPQILKQNRNAPVVLYVKGRKDRLNQLSIAIVGSRRASIYGLLMAEKFAEGLAGYGITIVSGMARGIDSAAHRGCLRGGGTTIAVLGSGLANIYPPENKNLMQKIIQEGIVISEFSMETPPLSYNFPRRNRIVSGLSCGVIVVEASQRSGALITSHFALEQGKEVFAVPGNIDHPNTKGVHALIKQGAKLVCCLEDILEEIAPEIIFRDNQEKNKPESRDILKNEKFTEKEEEIYRLINKKPIYVDELVNQCHYTLSDLSGTLLKLQLKSCILQLPGNYFVRA